MTRAAAARRQARLEVLDAAGGGPRSHALGRLAFPTEETS